MPNWCYNTTRFNHADPEKVAGLVAELKKDDGKLFQYLHPMPEELRETTSPNSDEAQSKLMQEKYGYPDWYSWCVNEWGTKWDAGVNSWEEDGGQILVSFETAWAPPIALYDKLVNAGWDVYSTYIEEGMCFVGEYSEGFDECYDYSDATSETIGDYIPDHLDEEYCISENMQAWEDNDEEEVG